MPERPPAVVASTPEGVLRDLETSDDNKDDTIEDATEDAEPSDDDDDDDDDDDTLDSVPSSSAARQEARPLATAIKRPKRLQRRPAKIAALASAQPGNPRCRLWCRRNRNMPPRLGNPRTGTIVRRTPRMTTAPHESLRYFRLMCRDLVHARKIIFLISDLISA